MPQAEDRVLEGCPPRSPRRPQTPVTGLSPRLRFRPTGYRGEAPTPSSLDLINLLEQPTDLGETFRRHDCGLAMKGYNPGRDTEGQVRARGAMPSPGPPLPQSPPCSPTWFLWRLQDVGTIDNHIDPGGRFNLQPLSPPWRSGGGTESSSHRLGSFRHQLPSLDA